MSSECAVEWPTGHKLAMATNGAGTFRELVVKHFRTLAAACVGITHGGGPPRTYLAAIPADMRTMVGSHIEVPVTVTAGFISMHNIRVLDQTVLAYPTVYMRDEHIILACYSGAGADNYIVKLNRSCNYDSGDAFDAYAGDMIRARYVIRKCT